MLSLGDNLLAQGAHPERKEQELGMLIDYGENALSRNPNRRSNRSSWLYRVESLSEPTIGDDSSDFFLFD